MATAAKTAPVKKSYAAETAENLNKIADQIEKAAKTPDYGGRTPASLFGQTQAPWGTSGAVGRDSAGYSILKAAAYCNGFISADQAKEELQTHTRLKEIYHKHNFRPHNPEHRVFYMPYATEHMPHVEDDEIKFANEVHQKCVAGVSGHDPDEAAWIAKKIGGDYAAMYRQKAVVPMGTISDTSGGVLVGFPTLGELIDLQRNMEVFPAAGATETSLPPNGRIQYPKLTGGATAYMVGEAAATTESNQSTGNLNLEAKKLGVLVRINNELFRYSTVSAEGMIRMDIARVASLKADQQMLEGTGGVQIKGLTKYDTATSWSTGVDKLLLYTAGAPATNGDTFQAEDVAGMEAILPDAIAEPTAWIMRKQFFSKIMTRRGDAAVPGDQAGPFLFWTSVFGAAQKPPMELYNVKVIRSSQVSNTRVKGTHSDLTYVLLGYFPDWIIARSGVMEFLMASGGDTTVAQDQTLLRGIQHLDAGARHAASFVLVDQLLVA